MQHLIERYGLQPHPEGGYYREIHRSPHQLRSPQHGDVERSAWTHIYYLLAAGQVSRFHRVAQEEIWHLYDGDPLRLYLFDGSDMKVRLLGGDAGQPCCVIPAGAWQAAEPLGAWTLSGCTVAPGFEFEDFTFLDPDSEPARILQETHPAAAHLLPET